MQKIAMVVHGGAGPDSPFIRDHITEYEEGLREAVETGYRILEKGGTSAEAVVVAVKVLEDNKYFNAGRGATLDADGKVVMCTSMMEGKEMRAGAAALVKNVKNPITLAKAFLDDGHAMYLGGPHASDVAKDLGLEMEVDAYFITDHQFDTFSEKRARHPEASKSKVFRRYHDRMHGTVGAVAVDKAGNVAAGTSTGGTDYSMPGRIGDSSMIGTGSYADNRTAAISSTGDGEYLIREVICHSVAAAIEHTQCTVEEACNYVINVKNKDTEGDMGLIAVDAEGNIALEFNCERMHRAWKTPGGMEVKIYR